MSVFQDKWFNPHRARTDGLLVSDVVANAAALRDPWQAVEQYFENRKDSYEAHWNDLVAMPVQPAPPLLPVHAMGVAALRKHARNLLEHNSMNWSLAVGENEQFVAALNTAGSDSAFEYARLEEARAEMLALGFSNRNATAINA